MMQDLKHTAYILEVILQNELKNIVSEEYKDRGSSNMVTHVYAQGYLSAVRRMKKILLKQKDRQHDTATTFRLSQ